MKNAKCFQSFGYMLATAFAAAACAIVTLPLQAQQQKSRMPQKMFASPEDAIKALLETVKINDKVTLHEIFGPDAHELLTGDKVQDAANFQSFATALQEKCTPEPQGDDTVILDIGAKNWPFPIPLVKKDGQWFFDTDAGREEIINRHIGHDELNAIGVCRVYVEAQRTYFSQNPDGSGVRQYAQKFKSTPGRKDGLYWKTTSQDAVSPFGALVAEAHAEGYKRQKPGEAPKPFHGYLFKILTQQGQAAPGGKKNYLSHGEMTDGFALVAYPAIWDKSGIMTFIVGQDGMVYQANLGEKTVQIAAKMSQYNPDNKWKPVQDRGISEN